MAGHLGEHEQLIRAGVAQEGAEAGLPTNWGSIPSRRNRVSSGVKRCTTVSALVVSTVAGSTVRIRICPWTKEAASRPARSSSLTTASTATQAYGSARAGVPWCCATR
ncbi:hypothetical protein [Streptosporangium saharense]|uniref:hypothetical protein n=1 Tax=Streptosporangium saharense TaxID=1706840 RepID=UPI003324ED8B